VVFFDESGGPGSVFETEPRVHPLLGLVVIFTAALAEQGWKAAISIVNVDEQYRRISAALLPTAAAHGFL
jgi:hypothetical protein